MLRRVNEEFDVVIAHGPKCNDGTTSAYIAFSTLPEETKAKYKHYKGKYSSKPNIKVWASQQSVWNEKKNIEVDWTPVEDWKPYDPPTSITGCTVIEEDLVKFIFCQPGEVIPKELVQDKRVLVLDLECTVELVMEEVPVKEGEGIVMELRPAETRFTKTANLIYHAKKVTWIDHHESGKSCLLKTDHPNLELIFEISSMRDNVEIKESGCSLTWKYFYSDPLPPLFDLIRQGDTWDFNSIYSVDTQKLLAYMNYLEVFKGFNNIEAVSKSLLTNEDLVSFEDEMTDDRRYENVPSFELETAIECAKKVNIGKIVCNQDGKEVEYTVAYSHASCFIGHLGVLMRKYVRLYYNVDPDLCVCWFWKPENDLVICSMRDPKKGVNLATVSKTVVGPCKVSGGGHPGAASFNFQGLGNLPLIIH